MIGNRTQNSELVPKKTIGNNSARIKGINVHDTYANRRPEGEGRAVYTGCAGWMIALVSGIIASTLLFLFLEIFA
jgi:hypothetical protein